MPTPISVRNPRTGKNDYEFVPPTKEEITALAAELKQNQEAWSRQGLAARAKVLMAWKEEYAAKQEEILEALTLDTGRHFISFTEVAATLTSIDRWCQEAESLLKGPAGRSAAMPHLRYESQNVPYPLVTVVGPWNFPLLLTMIDSLPALVAGSAVIAKPSSVTPRFAEPLMETIEAIPELHGVLRFVQGTGTTAVGLIDESDAVCFTGSVEIGRRVGEQAAKNFIPAFLELGGKDPLIITKSADVELASTAALRASVLNAGQACQSIERIYVEAPLYEDFVDRLVEKAKEVDINYPDIHKGTIGPLTTEDQAETIDGHIKDAIAQGATVLSGGKIEDHDGGKWCRPTVLTNVTHEMRVMKEETFGPLLPVVKFDTIDEAVMLANDSEFGLSAAVMAGSDAEAIAIAERIDAGAVSINDAGLTTVFRDAEKNSFKLSGIGGSRMGPSGLTRFLRRKALIVNTEKPAPLAAYGEDQAPVSR